MRTPLFVANWKMNKLGKEAADFLSDFTARLADLTASAIRPVDVAIAPQSVYLDLVARHVLGKPVELAAQNCGPDRMGAYTGENSPMALAELGVKWVILGHSERRHVFREDGPQLRKRVEAALAQKLHVIYCVGETLEERRAEKTMDVILEQLSSALGTKELNSGRVVIAYEPVWAIGTGENATAAQAVEVHTAIRGWLTSQGGPGEKIRILYGGSVKPTNALELISEPEIDGFLVGGASLDPAAFAEIIGAGVKESA